MDNRHFQSLPDIELYLALNGSKKYPYKLDAIKALRAKGYTFESGTCKYKGLVVPCVKCYFPLGGQDVLMV
jgi:hypothetical protein